MALNKDKKAQIIKEFARDSKDTGSPEVQIAILTNEINALTEHLKNNKQDKAWFYLEIILSISANLQENELVLHYALPYFLLEFY